MRVVLFIIIFAIVMMSSVLIRTEVGASFLVTILAVFMLRGIYNALFHNHSRGWFSIYAAGGYGLQNMIDNAIRRMV